MIIVYGVRTVDSSSQLYVTVKKLYLYHLIST